MSEWWLWHRDGIIFAVVAAFLGGVAFAIGHELVKAIVKRYTKEPW